MVAFTVIMFCVLATTLMLAPSPKRRNPFEGPRVPLAPPPREPELEHDPSAFWRYPDWESGPVEEPFWMRPLKLPCEQRFENIENYSGAVMYGTPTVKPVYLYRTGIGVKPERKVIGYEYELTVEACGICKMMKYGGWAGDWCDGCDDDTPSIHIPKTEAVARKVVRPNR
jgi:hypothetical protein